MAENIINIRQFVIESSISIEEFVSQTLGLLLGINWKKSKSLGFQSSCLSFNQKLTLIQDLKGLGKDDRKKLEHLMSIRNKFAHVSEVNSFEKFLSISTKKELKKDLEKWYGSKNENSDELEKTYMTYFIKLVLDISKILTNISKYHQKEIKFKLWKDKMNERLIKELKEALIKTNGGSSLYLSSIERIKTSEQE